MKTFHSFQFILEPADHIGVGVATRTLHFAGQLDVLLHDDLDTALAQAHDLWRCAGDLVAGLEQRKRDQATAADKAAAEAVNDAHRADDAAPFGTASSATHYVVRIPLTPLDCCREHTCTDVCPGGHTDPCSECEDEATGGEAA